MKKLKRFELKNLIGGLLPEETADCSKSDCQKKEDGTRKKCPTGCSCVSAEGNPCEKATA
jgi:hypothetical protein